MSSFADRLLPFLIVVGLLAGQVAGQEPAAGNVRLVFPQFVDAGGVVSTIMLVNPSHTTACIGALETFDRLGNYLPISVGGTVNTVHAFAIPPGGTIFLRTDLSNEQMTVGSARVRADRPLTGSITFAGQTGPVGFPAEEAVHTAVVPVESSTEGQVRTAIAVTSADRQGAILNLTLRDLSGATVQGGTTTVEMTPRGQLANYVEELLPAPALQNFKGSLLIESTRPIAVVGAHSQPGRLTAVSSGAVGQTHLFSFEGGLEGWQPVAIDVQEGQSTAEWSIVFSSDRASDGRESLRLRMNNLTDAGKIWIQRAIPVEPNKRYRVRISYSLATADYGDVNLWTVIAGVLTRPPTTRTELPYQGNTGNGAVNDIGFVWSKKNYEVEVQSGADGLLFPVIGVWGTWETLRSYYIDELVLSIREIE